MKNQFITSIAILTSIFVSGCSSHREIDVYTQNDAQCFDRKSEPYT